MQYIAYITTTATSPMTGADPGISVFSEERDDDGYLASEEIAREDIQDGSLDSHDGRLDLDAATQLLARMGFEPAGDWQSADGQYMSRVVPA